MCCMDVCEWTKVEKTGISKVKRVSQHSLRYYEKPQRIFHLLSQAKEN